MLGLFLILPVFAVAARQAAGRRQPDPGRHRPGHLRPDPGGAADCPSAWPPTATAASASSSSACCSSPPAASWPRWAPDIYWIIVGRILQGAGAISAAVTALAADLTREQHRTKVMAMIGSSIGLVFALSLVAAPALYKAWIGMGGLFIMTGVLALAAILLVLDGGAGSASGRNITTTRRSVSWTCSWIRSCCV
jgi:hypothetical protein